MIHLGDSRTVLRGLPKESWQMAVTSPPYFGLRDYGVDGQIGLEPTAEQFIETLVDVFREARRVLRKDGTLWVNIGDSYGSTSTYNAPRTSKGEFGRVEAPRQPRAPRSPGVKPKDVLGIPWMLALALRADGWYLRQSIIWHKPNPMPESVRDRCTNSHEYVFLLSKRAKYYFDADAISEPCSPNTRPRRAQNVAAQAGSARGNGGTKVMKAVGRRYDPGARARNKNNPSFDAAMAGVVDRRNKRSVWTVTTKGFKGAHFATFPPDLIAPCILAGSRPGDVVGDPFMGAGTTAVVCERLGRRWEGVELNPEYKAIADQRIAAEHEAQRRIHPDLFAVPQGV